jgi:hypothetical protein
LIAEHGQPSPNLVDVDNDDVEQRRIQILEGIAKGECDIDEGRCFTDRDARDKLKIWLD